MTHQLIKSGFLVLIGVLIGWAMTTALSGKTQKIAGSARQVNTTPSNLPTNFEVPNWCVGEITETDQVCQTPVFKDITEIILVVEDLEASMKKQWELFGIGPWAIWTFSEANVKDMVQHDQPKTFSAKIAYTKIGNVHWELVQPLDEHSTYYETLRDHGEGVHNIVFAVQDYDKTVKSMASRGIGIYNSGDWQGTRFLNFATRPHLPIIAEIFHTKPGASFPEPEEIYPQPSE